MYPSKTTRLCIIGLTTALICIMAQLSIPLPFGIPMTMQTFAVMLTGILLDSKIGTLHYAITQHVSIRSAAVICVLPFLLPTILKIICAAAIGIRLKIRLAPFLSFPSQQTEEMS